MPAIVSVPVPAAAPTARDLAKEARAGVERAAELLRALEGAVSERPPSADLERRVEELERELAASESDRRELAAVVVESERRIGRLTNLYVATYQLHSTLDPDEVRSTIGEIVVNLLGAEQFVVLLRSGEGGGPCSVALAEGLANDPLAELFSDGEYCGGDPTIDATLSDGLLRLQPEPESLSIAAVPLAMQGVVVGAIAILKLLEHKHGFEDDDRELLDLLAAHAASALLSAQSFARADRKLRTLENLVKLVRGESLVSLLRER